MQHSQKQLFTSLQYDQFTPEIIDYLIGMTQSLDGDLIVNLSIPTSKSTAMPEIPLGLAAQADRNEHEMRFKKGRELMVRMKQQCKESRIHFTGMISKRKRRIQTSKDVDMVLLARPFQSIRLSSFLVGHIGLHYMRKKHAPVWLIPSQRLEFDSVCFFSLSPSITAGQNEFIEEHQHRFDLPNPTYINNKDSIINILTAESKTACSSLEETSLLVFSESCFYGIPLVNKLYMKFLFFLRNACQHIVIIPE